ncbi:unnamed protein product [Coregonus sp. 'balchen']|nr:unnamed protein product [Coregonus sp. 'balchen']
MAISLHRLDPSTSLGGTFSPQDYYADGVAQDSSPEKLSSASPASPMWGKLLPVIGRKIAALSLGLVMSHLVVRGSAVKVLSQPGNTVQFPCSYSYEDHQDIPQLSVQWRGPGNTLLCHYIKHKVRTQDFGSHVCSVSKRHEFSDFSIELATKTGRPDGHLVVLVCSVFVSTWG